MIDPATPSAPTELRVELGGRAYAVVCGRGLAARVRGPVDEAVSSGSGAVAVVDAAVEAAQGAWLEAALGAIPRVVLPGGEPTKQLAVAEDVLRAFARHRLERRGLVVAVGGGVVGDLAGFAAACWQRGTPVLQVPTTLLAMVDSSVGGKTGVNLPEGKNLVGAFWQPRLVVADTALLDTLPPREFAAGMAEVIKAGLIGDAPLLGRLEREPITGPGSSGLPAAIHAACSLKAAVVAGDEREELPSGGRALLNLGHTFGHAIEAVAGYGALLHGEAVAIGLVLAARLSEELGRVPRGVAARVAATVAAHRLPTRLATPLPIDALMDAMARDKKVRGGRLRFVVLDGIGAAATAEGVDPGLVRALWAEAGAA